MDIQPDQDAEDPPPLHGGPSASTAEPGGPDRRLETCRRLLQQERIIDRTLYQWVSANAELAMLLELYAAERDGRQVYLWQVCNAITIPAATAHRKLGKLTDRGLTVRTPMTLDRRRIGLRLTPSGVKLIEALLDRLAL